MFLILGACVYIGTDHKSIPNDFKSPIILVAKSKEGSIIIKDSTGRYASISGIYISAAAISASLEVGDTLK